MVIRSRAPLAGCLIFACTLLLVYSLDLGISELISGKKNSESFGVTTRHFSWYLSDFFSSEGFSTFISNICEGKRGVLAEPLFYVSLLLAFTFFTVFLYINIFRESRKPADPDPGLSSFSGCEVRALFFLLAWLFVKQTLFIFLVPPWQGPDEPFHYLVSASRLSEVGGVSPKILKSSKTFHFMKYTERRHDDHVPHWRSKEELWNNQPPLYYLLNSHMGKFLGIQSLPEGVYLGRIISSLCLAVTVLTVYLIAFNVFSGHDRAMLSGLCSVFAATNPQLSYVGATMSPDAMVNMFITGAVFFLLLSLKSELRRKIVIYYLSAIFFSLFAMLTKRSGFSMIPILLFAGLQVCYLRFTSGFRSGILPLLVPALIAGGMILLYALYLYFDLNVVFSERVINYSKDVIETRVNGIWSQSSLKILMVLFVSFCLSFGWMVFKASLGTYLLFAVITLVVVFGVIVNSKKRKLRMEKSQFTLLIFQGVLVFMMAFTHFDSQGRYMFPAIGVFSVLFAVGTGAIIPERHRASGVKIIEGNLLLYSGTVVFCFLIPVFYLVWF